MRTREGFFPSVRTDMLRQTRFVRTTFPTVCALIMFVITSNVVHGFVGVRIGLQLSSPHVHGHPLSRGWSTVTPVEHKNITH